MKAAHGALFLLLIATTTSAAPIVAFAPASNQVSASIEADTLIVRGSEQSDVVVLSLNRILAHRLEIDVGGDGVGEFSFDREEFSAIEVEGGGDRDVLIVDEENGVFTDTEATSLFGQEGGDYIEAGAGGDLLSGGPGIDDLIGRSGSDWILGGAGNDKLSGGGSNDRIRGGRHRDIVDAGSGEDDVRGGGGRDSLNGNGGDDSLRGGDEGDVLDGGGGRDEIYGCAGDDRLFARDGQEDGVRGGVDFDSARHDRRDRLEGIEVTT